MQGSNAQNVSNQAAKVLNERAVYFRQRVDIIRIREALRTKPKKPERLGSITLLLEECVHLQMATSHPYYII